MADTVSKMRRSEIMSSIKGVDTTPELIVRKYLFSKGLRFRLHNKNLPGKPDISLKKHKCLVFVNGCFWHGHPNCKIFVMPKSNKKYWQLKINKNIERDQQNSLQLKKMGWRVFVVWECELKKSKRQKSLERLAKKIIH